MDIDWKARALAAEAKSETQAKEIERLTDLLRATAKIPRPPYATKLSALTASDKKLHDAIDAAVIPMRLHGGDLTVCIDTEKFRSALGDQSDG